MNTSIKTIIRFSLALLILPVSAQSAEPAVFKDCPECPEMVALPSGSFTMGSTGRSSDESARPTHTVNIKAFAIGKYEVTQDEWFAIMGSRPAQFKGGRNPVEQVTWKLAREFVRKLSEKTGKRYRLPTEAEWEYAARAGTEGEYYFDKGSLAEHAWFDDNSEETTHPVGQRKPNAFGLHDMYGNVWEWTDDCWNENYAGAPDDGSAWIRGGDCGQRVARGGTWYSKPTSVGSTVRGKFSSELRYSSRGGGLRVVRED